MRTPRFLRPHSVTIFNKLSEEFNSEAVYHDTVLSYVKVQGKTKSTVSTRKSNSLEVADEILIVVDLSDAPKYKPFEHWNGDRESWTAHTSGDYILYDNRKLAIIGFTEINPFCNYPEFVEMICQRI